MFGVGVDAGVGIRCSAGSLVSRPCVLCDFVCFFDFRCVLQGDKG